mmetsp:Transcript_30960/g.47361  ORF Transcript_30960/g.47361 Transcript_30960/m.47361 type:complete len:217 (-) Transcript_30960:1287-1937(-)
MEVPQKSRRDLGPPTTWRSSGTYDFEVIDHLLVEQRAVVDDSFVEQEAQELDGRLSPVDFELGHVDVVHENNALLVALGTKDLLTSLFDKLAFDRGLNLIRAGLRREVQEDRHIIVLGLIQSYVLLDDDRLASSSTPSEEDLLVSIHEDLEQLAVENSVDSRDEQLIIWFFNSCSELSHLVVPVLEHPFLQAVVVLEYRLFGRDMQLSEEVSEHVI